MAFRSQALFLICAGLYAQTYALRDGGELRLNDDAIVYKDKKARMEVWPYAHLQQVKLGASTLQLTTYEDSPKWRLGVDRSKTFALAKGSFVESATMLRAKLEGRFVSTIAEVPADAEWSVAVKRLGTLKGSEGTLYVTPDRVVYLSAVPGESRTWALRDVENVNSSGRFELTLTTYERSRIHYGSMRSFNFRLKEAVDSRKVDALWRRLQVNPDKS